MQTFLILDRVVGASGNRITRIRTYLVEAPLSDDLGELNRLMAVRLQYTILGAGRRFDRSLLLGYTGPNK